MKKIAFAALAVLTMGPALMSSSAFAFDLKTAPERSTVNIAEAHGAQMFLNDLLAQAQSNLQAQRDAVASFSFVAPSAAGTNFFGLAPRSSSAGSAFTGSDVRADGSRPWQ